MKTKNILIALLLVVIISGCYTVLRHPEVPNEDEFGNVYHQNINTGDNCYSCHAQKNNQIYDYDRYMNYYSNSGYNDNYEIQNRWDSYYSVPWWFRPPTVTTGVGSSATETKTNRTTSNSGNNVRPSGSIRNDVKITAPTPTRGADRTTGTTSGTTETKKESSASGRSESRDNNSGATTNTNRDSNNTNKTNNSDDSKRNSGSTRGK